MWYILIILTYYFCVKSMVGDMDVGGLSSFATALQEKRELIVLLHCVLAVVLLSVLYEP